MNLPNLLTLLRIALAPLLAGVLLGYPGERLANLPAEYVALGIFLAGALTDWLDGYFARRFQQITRLGQSLDPLADKVLVITAFMCLAQLDAVPAPLVAVIAIRELLVTGLRTAIDSTGESMPASLLGKAKMGAQILAVAILIPASGPLPELSPAGVWGTWIVAILSLISAVHYSRAQSANIRTALRTLSRQDFPRNQPLPRRSSSTIL